MHHKHIMCARHWFSYCHYYYCFIRNIVCLDQNIQKQFKMDRLLLKVVLRHLVGKEQAESAMRGRLLTRSGWMTQTGYREPRRAGNTGSRAGLESKPWEQKPDWISESLETSNFCVLPIFILLKGMSTEVILLPNVCLMGVEWMIWSLAHSPTDGDKLYSRCWFKESLLGKPPSLDLI